MFTKRIIPCLDVNNGRVVKGVNFVQLRDAGDPVEIGYMMLFLLSGASTYLTGQDFPVDGGAIPHGF